MASDNGHIGAEIATTERRKASQINLGAILKELDKN